MILSCEDLHRNKLISIIARLNQEDLVYENNAIKDLINTIMNFSERCNYINLNLVLLALHFQYRVEFVLKFLL